MKIEIIKGEDTPVTQFFSATPETDKVGKFWPCEQLELVDSEFARKLERERDEAREELSDIRLNLGADAEGYTLLHAVCAIQNERDEAREALRELWQTADAYIPQIDEEQATKWHHAMFGNSKNG
jgi:hypothetical protein